MAYEYPGAGALDYYPCRYGKSKLLFRGPRRDLTPPFVACLGGTETYGKFIPRPYPALVEAQTGVQMVNLGAVNAGLDVYLSEPVVMEIVSQARATVVQIVGAQNLSNRFYAVHPRRNDRFLRASNLLKTVFREVDFTEFHFTRHMLQTLQMVSPEKFEVVAEELRAAWVSRMIGLLGRLSGKTVLLWLAAHPPVVPGGKADLSLDPILIDTEMIAAVRNYAGSYVEAISSPEAQAMGLEGMAYSPMEEPAALGVPGPAVHAEVANKLSRYLREIIE